MGALHIADGQKTKSLSPTAADDLALKRPTLSSASLNRPTRAVLALHHLPSYSLAFPGPLLFRFFSVMALLFLK